MYITRFSRKDGNKEDYFYHTKREATAHLNLFAEDDSGLYQSIAVIDSEKDMVLRILPFENGESCRVISLGDHVHLKDEYCSEAENVKNHLYAVSNINEATGRLIITCLTSGMTIAPSETVGVEMVALA